MKTLRIPFLPQLDNMPMELVGSLMEVKAGRVAVTTRNWPKLYPYQPITSVDVAYSSQYIYLNYFVKGANLVARYVEDNDPVYKDSCVEFFVREEDSDEYYNFEINCVGAILSAHGSSRDNRQPLSVEQLATIKRYTQLPKTTISEKEGINSWQVLVAIPFNLFLTNPLRLPTKIRANFYKCADESSTPHFLSWAPIVSKEPDFHRPEYFGRIHLNKNDTNY